MPKKKAGEDPALLHVRAQRAALAVLAAQQDAYDLLAAVAPYDRPGLFTPDVAMLELAVTALDLACPPGAAPLVYEGLRERYLPEFRFRGRTEHRNSQYALYAAACMRGGLEPNLLDDAGWWQMPLWRYAAFALLIYARAAAERQGLDLRQVAERLAAANDLELPVDATEDGPTA
ncbi:MAG: hypothetical protein ACTHOD_10175 [Motilibacteraceae bacterium]